MAALGLSLCGAGLKAQTTFSDAFNTLKLEARADMGGTYDTAMRYGFRGRYFDLKMGGDLGNGFSYFLRQNIRANGGTIAFFDNTDFLWLNYQPNEHWRFRFGKDAMAVGGYEYDAAPLDEYLTATYWDNFYCFQMALSAAYSWDEGRQTVVAQVSQSPYVNVYADIYDSRWDTGLVAYNVEWLGSIGEHVHTLWSVNMMEYGRNEFMWTLFLGTQVSFERWDAYLDLMQHSFAADDWGRDIGVVARLNYRIGDGWTVFAKGSYEQNPDEVSDADRSRDVLMPFGAKHSRCGLGAEFRPKGMCNVRLHGYVGYIDTDIERWELNLGATWVMDFHKMFAK